MITIPFMFWRQKMQFECTTYAIDLCDILFLKLVKLFMQNVLLIHLNLGCAIIVVNGLFGPLFNE